MTSQQRANLRDICTNYSTFVEHMDPNGLISEQEFRARGARFWAGEALSCFGSDDMLTADDAVYLASLRSQGQRIIASIDQWTVAPEDRGQVVEVSYGIDSETQTMVRRTIDRSASAQEPRYEMASAPETWEPWNAAPEPAEWVPVRTSRRARSDEE